MNKEQKEIDEMKDFISFTEELNELCEKYNVVLDSDIENELLIEKVNGKVNGKYIVNAINDCVGKYMDIANISWEFD